MEMMDDLSGGLVFESADALPMDLHINAEDRHHIYHYWRLATYYHFPKFAIVIDWLNQGPEAWIIVQDCIIMRQHTYIDYIDVLMYCALCDSVYTGIYTPEN